jgi:hypothetical protein
VDSLWFYDSGGSTSNYGNNENYTITFKPRNIGQRVKVQFVEFDVESHSTCSFDYLIVYNGPDTRSPELGKYCGDNMPPVYTSTSANGELTFKFVSDGNTVGTGWKAKITTTSNITTYPVTFNVKSNGIAIPCANVNIANGIKFTSSSGSVNFNLPNGTYSYTVRANGYEPVSGSTQIASSARTIDVSLTKHDTIQLLLRSALDQAAIPLAKILVNNQAYYTSNLGMATIYIPAGDYTFNLTADGYYAKDTIITVQAGGGNHNINLLPASYNLQFTISDINGNKIPYATVCVDTLLGETNSEGLASFTLTRGLRTVSIQKERFISTDFWLELSSDSSVNVYLNPVYGNVQPVKFSITGTGPKGTWPMDKAMIKIYNGTELYLQGKTLNGVATLYLPNGNYSYEVSLEGYQGTEQIEFTVNSNPIEIPVQLNQLTFSITFDVQSGGSPVANATVKIKGYSDQLTDANGSATFSPVGYEKGLQYSVLHPNYYTISGTTDATKSGTISVNLTPTSTDIVDPDKSISMYPNPATSQIRIEANETIESVSIISINGTLMHWEQINNSRHTINLNLPTGVYVVRFTMGNGRFYHKKLMVR